MKRFLLIFLAVLPMNLAWLCVESQLGGNDAPYFLSDRFAVFWWATGLAQPWAALFLLPSSLLQVLGLSFYFQVIIDSLISAIIYSLVWLLLRRITRFRAFAISIRPWHVGFTLTLAALWSILIRVRPLTDCGSTC